MSLTKRSLAFELREGRGVLLLAFLWIVHGSIALWKIIHVPSDWHSFLLAMSPLRALLLALPLCWIGINLAFVISTWRGDDWPRKLRSVLENSDVRDAIIVLGIVILLAWAATAVLQSLLGADSSNRFLTVSARLWPLINLFALVSLESVLILALNSWNALRKIARPFALRLVVVEIGLALLSAFIWVSRLGIKPNNSGDWSRGLPAVPLLEWQLALAVIFCLGFALLESRGALLRVRHLDRWICFALWLGTVVLWLSQPVIPSASALKPRAPNYEVYPFIDAQVYDEHAQSLLIGNGFGADPIPQRPLYVVFLGFAHAIAGQSYARIIFLQTLLLAFFPVLLYVLGRDFFGRPIGISIALLAALRDYTSNLVAPFTGNISYSKLFLSELPTAILLLLCVLIALRWIHSGFRRDLAFLLGGLLGVGMLLRTQVIVALPVFLFFGLVVRRRDAARMFQTTVLAILAIMLVISPWFWHNWTLSGKLIFDNPGSQVANLALRYGRLHGSEPDISPLPGESDSQYNDRLKHMASASFAANRAGVITAVANSFLNHAVNNILLLPLRINLRAAGEFVTPSDAFWEKWGGNPTPAQGWLLMAYVGLFGLGLTAAWWRNGWLGFLPLTLNLAYNLWTSIALLSGQRFMLTMDWSIYLYDMIGVFALMSGLLFVLGRGRPLIVKWFEANGSAGSEIFGAWTWKRFAAIGIFFFAIGASLPLSERIFPQRYPLRAQQEILQSVLASKALAETHFDASCIEHVVQAVPLTLTRGRVLYPRYYGPGDGERFTDAVGYKKSAEGRIVFDAVGQVAGRVIIPLVAAPDFFPNAADITLLQDATGKPWFILVKDGSSERFYSAQTVDPSLCK